MDAPTDAPPETPMQFGIQIDSFKANDDGTITVFGPVTTERIDAVKDIVDADWAAKALDEWLNGPNDGNVRGQHQELWPTGRGMELQREGTTHKLSAVVVDPIAQKLIQHHILKAFSVGIVGTRRVWDTVKAAWRVVGGRINEVSIVDVPCNADTEFALAMKADEGAWKALDLFSRIDPKVLGSVLTRDEVISLAQKFALDTNHPLVQEALQNAQKAGDADRDTDKDADAAVSADLDEVQRALDQAKAEQARDAEGETDDTKAAKDPAVGGGVDRTKISKEDFVFPEDAPDGGFPVVTPGDVSDAVSDWGRYKGPHSFADFKKRLIAIAKRKGPKFVAALPDAWNVKVTHKAEKMDDDVTTETETEKAKGGQDVANDGGDGVTDDEADKEAGKDGDGEDDETEKALALTLSRLHAATCPVYETAHVAKLHPGTWAERLDIAPLETLFAEGAQKARDDGLTPGWAALSGALGTLAGPVVVARHVPDAVLDEAHSAMVSAQRAQKAGVVAEAVGAQPGTARSFYTNQEKGRHAEALKAIHDAVVGLRPDVCPLPAPAPNGQPSIGPAGWNTDGQPAAVNGSATEKSAAGAAPVLDAGAAVAATTAPEAETPKADPEAEPVAPKAQPEPVAAPVATAEKTTEKAVDINAVVEEMGRMFRTDMNKQIDAIKAEHASEIKALREEIDKLHSEPNPMEAPLRKALLRLDPMSAPVDTSTASDTEAMLRQWAADSSDPGRQLAAQTALRDLTTTP